MNTDKVFIAFSKEGKELLLFRKDNSSFIDLIMEVEYPKDKIDLTSLSPIHNSIDLRKYMLKSSIKNKYKKDREKLLSTKNYLIGLKVVVANYENWYSGRGIYNLVKHYRWEVAPSNYDMFRFVDKTKIHYDTTLDIYKDFNNEELLGFKENEEPEKLYHMPDFKNGKEYVIIKDDLFGLTQEGYLDKKTINEMGYKLRKNLLKY